MESMFEGVEFKELTRHLDNRGFFSELIRGSDPFFKEGFAQWSHSLMYNGVIKAWHYHKQQIDWWYVGVGVLRVGLCDLRPESKTYRQTADFLMGDHQQPKILKIPPGVAHGCQVIQSPCHLFYITSKEYNPDDEIRIPYDDPSIQFDWLRFHKIT